VIGDEEKRAVCAVLDSGNLAQGPEVAAFEAEFAAWLATAGQEVHAVAVSHGTVALQLALMALGIGRGDEVILPSFTFIATANAVHACGATPVFADIEPDTFTIDPGCVAAAVTPRTAAIMPVHLYGHPADMDAITGLAERHDLAVIEDAAQAHGAAIRGRRAGTLGTAACFSFYPTKNMTTGEGGMVTTTDAQLADRMRVVRNHGMRARYQYEGFGLNLRMTDIEAAIGRVQLRRLDAWNAQRRANAAILDATLRGVTVPVVRDDVEHVYHQYSVLSDDRSALMARLEAARISCGVYYPVPVHRTPQYAVEVRLPVTDDVSQRVLSLPVRPDLTRDELARIAEAVVA
jgi:dTDP-4-amino-4,6-dideoxygalactose transaminase